MQHSLLQVHELRTTFNAGPKEISAIDGVSFHVNKAETVGIVGESGCGKSVTALSVMRLIPDPPGKIKAGEILLEGEDILKKSPEEMRKIRGKEISMIFQDPMSSLNPVYTIGFQIAEAVQLHQGLGKKDALERAIEMLRLVGLASPERRVHDYPHMLSGGMRQRVMIAMALSCNPKLLIADEPTTALDVTVQAQILELMKKLKEEIEMAIILITHDLGIVAEMCERVIVMYAGKIVEETDTVSLFEKPFHPYTEGLLNSIPRIGGLQAKLHVIPGTVPNFLNMPTGCRFQPRCSRAVKQCKEKQPDLVTLQPGHRVACWLYS